MYQMNTQHKEQDDYSKLASSVAPSIAEEVTSPSIDETLADNPIIDNPIDFESLQSQNDEIYSWIYIPDTNINYPVCRSNTMIIFTWIMIFTEITAFQALFIHSIVILYICMTG